MKKLNDLKMKWKLLVGFGIVIILTLAMAVFSLIQLQNIVVTYSNVLNGTVSGSVSLLNIGRNYARYRRIASTAVIYSGNSDMVITIMNEYNTLRSETNTQFTNYYAALDEGTATLSNAEMRDRRSKVDELKSLLDNEYHIAINTIFDYAKNGNTVGVTEELMKASDMASSINSLIDTML